MSSDFQTSEIVLMVGVGILIMVALSLIMVAYAAKAQRRLLQQRMDHQAMELRYQQELVQKNLQTQEAERQRIAAHLHDDISSKLGVLHLTFHRLVRTHAPSEEHDLMKAEIDDLIANTLGRVRAISHELLPPTLEDFGLIEALKELCDQIRRTGAVGVQLDTELQRADIGDADTELHLFRIVQELCNNTLKYAQASQIKIALRRADEKKQLLYTDNGRGFDPAATGRKGLGLKNLESRAKMIGAELNIQTAPGKGFQASVIF